MKRSDIEAIRECLEAHRGTGRDSMVELLYEDIPALLAHIEVQEKVITDLWDAGGMLYCALLLSPLGDWHEREMDIARWSKATNAAAALSGDPSGEQEVQR